PGSETALEPDELGPVGIAVVLQQVGQHQARAVLLKRHSCLLEQAEQLRVGGAWSDHQHTSPWKRCQSEKNARRNWLMRPRLIGYFLASSRVVSPMAMSCAIRRFRSPSPESQRG